VTGACSGFPSDIPTRAAKLLLVALILSFGQHCRAASELGGDFALQSAEGTVRLAEYRGKVVPLYFGYMSCPDLCPMTLSALGAALGLLDDAEREQVHALFISIDPKRDDLERLSRYARHFHPQITGVTGSSETIGDLARRYRIAFAESAADAPGFYTLDHTSRLALIGREGNLERFLPDGTPPVQIAEAIRLLLAR
jgi:protein SCO1/2